ncbi:MAG: LmeA family phospholipid-binding protein [Acidimicrobiia bacterium]|nr:LmeA family phospholipid-binding protein [Acidimicrobiia bacterium]
MVVALLVGADLAVRRAVEVQLENRIRDEVAQAQGAPPQRTRVRIASFPFLLLLLATGEVSEMTASVSDVEVSGLRIADIGLDLQDVHIDRRRLLGGKVELEGIRLGQATAEVTQTALREALGGLPVVLGAGTIGVTVGGVTASVSARVTDGVLRLSAAGVRLPAITLPTLPLLPCVTQATAEVGLLQLSCTIDRVPQELLERVGA